MPDPDFSEKIIYRFQLCVILTALLTIFIGITRSQQSWGDYQNLDESKNILQETLSKLSSETQHLEQEIHRLESSPIYAQKVLKDKYHITEKAEEIVIIQE